MKIEYAKQNANQLSGELVSLVFTRVMEQATKERATVDTTDSIVKRKGICNRRMMQAIVNHDCMKEETKNVSLVHESQHLLQHDASC